MKNSIKIFAGISITVLLGATVGDLFYSKKVVSRLASGDHIYTLRLSDERITDTTNSYSWEISANVNTDLGNSITIKASDVIKYNDGWQTFLPGGYLYNPLTNNANHNKLSGMSSITYTSSTSSNLSLYYGSTINNNQIIYSHKVSLSSGVTYDFNNEKPQYFYLKNDGNTNVSINNLSINYSCEDTGYSKQNLNVLMIGNSFSDDTVFYASRVARAYGINLNIYDAYIASCTIATHYNNLVNNNSNYSYRNMYTDGSSYSWNYQDNKSLTQILNDKSWDIITFQQASASIGDKSSYANLSSLVNGVRSIVGSTSKFYWYQTWSYDSHYTDEGSSIYAFSQYNNDPNEMYEAIVDAYEDEVASLGVFEGMIPAGTTVQNLKTSYMNETITRDFKHMSSVHGRYLLALNMVSHLFNIDLDMSNCSYLPNEVDPSYKTVAYEAIRNAYNHPLESTNSNYTVRELSGYDLSQYTEIDAELVGCSLWNSTDSSNYNKRISNSSGTSNYYVSTKRFTSSTLPVGSLVVIDDAFGVRPEAWVSDAKQDTRPGETYANVIEVDSSFFSGYLYRAFNIFKIGKSDPLKGQYDQIFDGFHIYVPNASMGTLEPKDHNSYYDSDKLLLKNNLINIDAFEKLHLDPITGFYKCDSYADLNNSYVDDTAKKFMCTRPFYSFKNDLPENTVIIVDSGYQWRSDCWTGHWTYSPRPSNVSTTITILDSSFWSGFRTRTFNVSSTSSSYVNQNYISFFNHMRIYVPVSEDIYIEPEDKVTMTALGHATLSGMASSLYGKSSIPVLITLHGDSREHVKVEVDGTDIGATEYTYNKSTGALSITTTGSAGGYSYGTVSGTVNKDSGTISNLRVNGSISSYISNNGSITCSESWHDRCNYSTNSASQLVWQRWYMSGSWQANSGSGEWTTANNVYRMEEDYSMGLRIANSSYKKTRFTLKSDFNSGSGFTPKGISVWLYNPNGAIYSSFRIYVYTAKSSTSGDHAVPSSSYTQAYITSDIGSNEWKNIKLGLNYGTIYNISFYFETNSSATTYVYLGHVSFY